VWCLRHERGMEKLIFLARHPPKLSTHGQIGGVRANERHPDWASVRDWSQKVPLREGPARACLQLVFKRNGLPPVGKTEVTHECPRPVAGGGRRIAGIVTQNPGLQIVDLPNIPLTEAGAFNQVHIVHGVSLHCTAVRCRQEGTILLGCDPILCLRVESQMESTTTGLCDHRRCCVLLRRSRSAGGSPLHTGYGGQRSPFMAPFCRRHTRRRPETGLPAEALGAKVGRAGETHVLPTRYCTGRRLVAVAI